MDIVGITVKVHDGAVMVFGHYSMLNESLGQVPSKLERYVGNVSNA
jgi:hypothetical protein